MSHQAARSHEEQSHRDESKECRFCFIHDDGEIFDVENFVADFAGADSDEGEAKNGLEGKGNA